MLPNGRLNFTKAALNSLTCPPDRKCVYYKDEAVTGLEIRITENGVASFVWVRKTKGTVVRKTLGRYPDLPIEAARGLASELNGKRAKGEAVHLGGSGTITTLGGLWEHYLEFHAKPHKRTWQTDEDRWRRNLKQWRNRLITDIDRAAITAWHTRLGKDHGQYEANRNLALLSKMFSHGRNLGFFDSNPAERIPKFRERSRERFMDATELKRFLHALEDFETYPVRDIFYMLLLTGQRKSNVCKMQWSEINFDRALWTIPGDKTKTGTDYKIPLVPDALDLLRRRRREQDQAAAEGKDVDPRWVFPSRQIATQPQLELKRAWARLVKRAQIDDFHVHDLRRTFGSWQAAAGTSLQIIGRSLGHRSLKSTEVYSRLDLDPVRAAVETAVAAMLATAHVHTETAIDDTDSDGAVVLDVAKAADA